MKTELDKNEMLQLLFLKKLKHSTEQESPPIANVLLAAALLSDCSPYKCGKQILTN